jgi:predicted alpha/beta superfamily hydrolase
MPLRTCCLLLAIFCSSVHADEQVECMPGHETFQIESSVMTEKRTVNAYLPPQYYTNAKARFPVLYMLDGGEREDFPHVSTAIARAINDGSMRPVILIGIENTQRRRDMTGPTHVESDRTIAAHVGESARFRSFIKAELFQEVDERYRTSPNRGIIGESLAGLFIAETFILDRPMFDTYIAFSPSLWWNGGQLLRDASTPDALKGDGEALYMASADEENIVPFLQEFRMVLAKLDPPHLNWTIEEYPSLSHATIYRALAPTMLRKYYPPIEL